MKRVILLWLCLCGAANASNRYVDNSGGSDANAGTSSGAAWEHIVRACTSSVIAPGDTIFIAPGVYAELDPGPRIGPGFDFCMWPRQDGNSSNRIVWRNYPGEARPTIKGDTTIQGADIKVSAASMYNLSYVTFDSLRFSWGYRFGVFTNFGDHLIIENCAFDSIGWTEATGENPGAVAVIDNDSGDVVNLTIRDNTMRCSKNAGVHLYSFDTIFIYRNRIIDCPGGINFKGPTNVTVPAATYAECYENVISASNDTLFRTEIANSAFLLCTQGRHRSYYVHHNIAWGYYNHATYGSPMVRAFEVYSGNDELYRHIYFYNNTMDCIGLVSGFQVHFSKDLGSGSYSLDSSEVFNNIWYLPKRATGSHNEKGAYAFNGCSTPGCTSTNGLIGPQAWEDYDALIDTTASGDMFYWDDLNITNQTWTLTEYRASCPQAIAGDNNIDISDTTNVFVNRGANDYTLDPAGSNYTALSTQGRGGAYDTYFGALPPTDTTCPIVAQDTPADDDTIEATQVNLVANFTVDGAGDDVIVTLFGEKTDATPDVLLFTDTIPTDSTGWTYNWSSLLEDSIYYWQIIATDTSCADTSAIRSFLVDSVLAGTVLGIMGTSISGTDVK